VAGLYACHNLKKLGIDFVLLESSDRLGGRVQQQEINGVNIEIGAEFIHGSCSILNHLLKKLKMSYRPTFDWTSPESKESLGYFFNGKLHKTTEVQELLDIFDKMTEVYPESNMTLFEVSLVD
jgi:monoamine oxidase